ncbi:histidine kinase 4 [Prunus yedoensis var. nudiflora]|uniref:Histidine kinase 4 n=1 Tax=Prunus yedoensis var. nudiflora TaxID=2094558 RepID=A0A314ZJL8_PRUYE|nr:histidine kinase 4 [Prunus yedoensis var. nudiflora]
MGKEETRGRRSKEVDLVLMGGNLKMQSHHSVAVRLNEQTGTKKGYTFVQAYRAWFPKLFILWIIVMFFLSMSIYNYMDADNKVRRVEVLGSMCDQRARMLQINSVLALIMCTPLQYLFPHSITTKTHQQLIRKLLLNTLPEPP